MTASDHLGEQFDWRAQPANVAGKKFNLGDVSGGRMYHGSPHRLEPGAVVQPGVSEANHKQSPMGTVSVTSAEWNARRWAKAAGGTEHHIYEVEPMHPVELHRAAPADYGKSFQVYEGRTRSARVVRELPPPD